MQGYRDLVICGSGPVGATLALALRRCLGTNAGIVLSGAPEARKAGIGRSFTVAGGPRRMLEKLGIWSRIEQASQPFHAMEIFDRSGIEGFRPPSLVFDDYRPIGEPLAHIVPEFALDQALARECESAGIEIDTGKFADLDCDSTLARFSSDSGLSVRTPLVVAADGKRSPVRAAAGIRTTGWQYDRKAIVGTVQVQRPHEGLAQQYFYPSGPIALLPMTENRFSLVWVETFQEAERLCGLSGDKFLKELAERTTGEFGRFELADSLSTYPLELRIARHFAGKRIALCGDAAHTIHPLAGQGLNLGFRDVAALADLVAAQARLGLDTGAGHMLSAYESWRRFDTMAMAVATDGLHRVFGAPGSAIRYLRDIGMRVVDRTPLLKAVSVREAAGTYGSVPELFK